MLWKYNNNIFASCNLHILFRYQIAEFYNFPNNLVISIKHTLARIKFRDRVTDMCIFRISPVRDFLIFPPHRGKSCASAFEIRAKHVRGNISFESFGRIGKVNKVGEQLEKRRLTNVMN